MPPLALHTFLARQVADLLRLPALEAQRGNLYLGSTAPDIRILTRWERQRTHFFDLERFDEQSGVRAFFDTHPLLADASVLTPATASFVAGYVTHLVMDEHWIVRVYRPFFGRRSPLGGTLRANIMDRALQFGLDCERRNDDELMVHVLGSIARSELDLDLGFIDRDTLRQWHRVIMDFVGQPPDWERFRTRAARHLAESGLDSQSAGDLQELARSLPELVDEALRHLQPGLVEECMRESLDSSLAAVKGYLCA